jgi:hypothetical protein
MSDAFERVMGGIGVLMPVVGLFALLALLAIACDALGRWAIRGARWLRARGRR